MTEQLSRRSLLRLAGTASAALSALALGFVLPQQARAASFDTTSVEAVVDFTRQSLDKFSFKALFDNITSTTDPADIQITVSMENIRTAEVASWKGNPTTVR